MEIALYTDPAVFDDLADEWHNLMGRAVTAPIFMTPDYQKVWWQHLGEGRLRVLAVREPDLHKLVGLASLLVDDDRLKFVGCVDVSDYLDFVVDADYCLPVYEAIIHYLAHDLAAEWQTAHLCSLSARVSPTLTLLAELARARGWTAEVMPEDVCPVIALAASWEDYLKGVDKKQRHEIKRKLRKAETEAQTRWYVIDRVDLLTEAAIDTFIALHRKSAPDKNNFWSPPMVAFFRALIWQMAQKGWLKLYFVDINGVTASALLCFDYQNEILVYNSGFDMEQFAQFSPGNIIVSYSIQHAIELGRARYDFLRGDEVYKFRFGAVAEEVCALKLEKESG